MQIYIHFCLELLLKLPWKAWSHLSSSTSTHTHPPLASFKPNLLQPLIIICRYPTHLEKLPLMLEWLPSLLIKNVHFCSLLPLASLASPLAWSDPHCFYCLTSRPRPISCSPTSTLLSQTCTCCVCKVSTKAWRMKVLPHAWFTPYPYIVLIDLSPMDSPSKYRISYGLWQLNIPPFISALALSSHGKLAWLGKEEASLAYPLLNSFPPPW